MRILWTLGAAEDLREIHDYLFVDSPQAAHKIVNEIHKAILSLKKMP